MKKLLVAISVLVSLLLVGGHAQTKKKEPCAASLDDCAREGCSKDNHHDPQLNRLKNLKSNSKPVTDSSLTAIKRLENKVLKAGYKRGDPRTVLSTLGEGTQIRVVGYLLAVKKEGGESCNCGLSEVDVTTDNHLVLVNPQTVEDFPLPPKAKKKTLTASKNAAGRVLGARVRSTYV
jgi:hypothetical protein